MRYHQYKFQKWQENRRIWVVKGTIDVLAIHCGRPTDVNLKDLVVFAIQSAIIVAYVVINNVQ